MVAFAPPDKRNIWATHGTLGCYIGPALHHYSCWKIYVTKTAATRMRDKVKFIPKKFKMPILSSSDTATQVALYLTEALRHPHADLPYAPFSDNTITELNELSDIFTNANIANPTIPSSSHLDTPKIPSVKTCEAGEATRVEEV